MDQDAEPDAFKKKLSSSRLTSSVITISTSGGLTDESCSRSSSSAKKTTAVTRKWSDVDHTKLLGTVALSTAGCCLISQPLYLVLARQQCSRERISMTQMARMVWTQLGMSGFFRGSLAAVSGMVIFQMLYYIIVELGKEFAPFSSKTGRDFLSGVAADALTNPISIPFAVIAERQMVAGYGIAASEPYLGFVDTTRDIVQNSGGRRALFRGLGLSTAMIPLAGCWWALYEQLKGHAYTYVASKQASGGVMPSSFHTKLGKLPSWCTSTTDNPALNLALGGVSSCIVTFLANPLFVVVARVQIMRPPASVKSPTLWVAKDLLRYEGVRGMFRGVRTNMLVSILEGSVFAGAYEGTKCFADATDE